MSSSGECSSSAIAPDEPSSDSEVWSDEDPDVDIPSEYDWDNPEHNQNRPVPPQKITHYEVILKSKCILVREELGDIRKKTDLFVCSQKFPEIDKYDEMLSHKAFFIQQNTETKDIEIYTPYPRKQTNFKGGHQKVPCSRILTLSLDEFKKNECGWLFSEFISNPKNLQNAGINVRIKLLRPSNPGSPLDGVSSLCFRYDGTKILKRIEDIRPFLHGIFENGTQITMKKMFLGQEMCKDLEFADAQKTLKTVLDMEKFLDLLKKYKKKNDKPVPLYKLRNNLLRLDLKPYQLDTVRWMIHREVHDSEHDRDPIWNKTIKFGRFFYYPELGVVTKYKSEWDLEEPLMRQFSVRGGILADEMGLGKTVQILAVIATHRKDDQRKVEVMAEDEESNEDPRERQTNDSIIEQIQIAESSYKEMKNAKNSTSKVYFTPNFVTDAITCTFCMAECSASICRWDNSNNDPDLKFVCPACLTDMPKREIKTTLIVLPESLIHQWFSEIAKHCSNNLRVMFYFGLTRNGYMQPHEMDQYDIILTTYDTLTTEMAFTNNVSHARTSRNPIPLQFLITPLIHVKFWRVVVDESQLIPKDSAGKLSQMLLKIHAENFWCVTGTPLMNSVNDMLTSFHFLDIYPFCFKAYFDYAMKQYLKMCDEQKEDTLPPNMLMDSLSRIFTRKTREDVRDQLNLPTLVEEERRVQFTAIEERQYKEGREKLKKALKKLIEHLDGGVYLKNMICRDKVLSKLARLQGLILTGQNLGIRAGEDGGISYIFSPETIVYRLVHLKKQAILQAFRNTMFHMMGLAGTYQLQKEVMKAKEIYDNALKYLDELNETETYIAGVIGADEIKRVTSKPEVEQREESDEDDESDDSDHYDEDEDEDKDDDADADADADESDDSDHYDEDEYEDKDDDSDADADAEKLKSTVHLREIKQLRKKYYKTPREEKEFRDAVEKIKEGPAAKKKRKNEVLNLDEEIVDDQIESEKEKKEREEHTRKMATIAFKPMKMDGTQHLHLKLNSVYLCTKHDITPWPNMDNYKEGLRRYIAHDKKYLERLLPEMKRWKNIWDDKDYIGKMTKYFGEWSESHKNTRDPDGLFTDVTRLHPTLKNRLLPYLPFNPIYNDGGPTKALKVHNLDTCMGGCSPHYEPAMFVNENSCLPLHKIIIKTVQHLQYLTQQRVKIEKQVKELLEVLIGLSDADRTSYKIIVPFCTTEEGTMEDKLEKNIIFCKHSIIKGTRADKQDILPKSFEENPCLLCEVHTAITMLNFELGHSTFHGTERHCSGVLEFIKYLDSKFSRDTYKSDKFIRLLLNPFFDRLRSFVKAQFKAVLIGLEFVDRFDELRMAIELITDEQVAASLPRRTDNVEANREAFVNIATAEATDAWRDAKKHMSEIRYLTNLLKEQMNGRAEEQLCPICDTPIISFMVFTCGHRVCMTCFEKIKDPKTTMAPDDLSRGIVPCPSCRTKNAIKEVMIAKSGYTETETLIPGVQLSAKMTAAIKLINEIIVENDSNRIILFTSIDPSNSSNWRYIQKILKQAGLKYLLLSKQNCAKKLIDFHMNAHVLLCPLSFGANGLNITCANHIIFLDPPHLRSVLHQAMGRINRYGQTKDMKVWHLLLEGSLDMELRSSALKEDQQEREKNGWTIGDIRAMFGIKYCPKTS